MARTELDRALRPGLLDRLTDLDLGSPADPVVTREASLRAYRMAVQRDVETLLNTRRTIIELPEGCPETARSLFLYGLPDTSGIGMGSDEAQQGLANAIRDTLVLYEPRLDRVTVRLASSSQVGAPQVRFTVEAVLRMDPYPEPVVFDTVFEVARGTIDVQAA